MPARPRKAASAAENEKTAETSGGSPRAGKRPARGSDATGARSARGGDGQEPPADAPPDALNEEPQVEAEPSAGDEPSYPGPGRVTEKETAERRQRVEQTAGGKRQVRIETHTSSRTVTAYPDGREVTESTTEVSNVSEAIPVPYQPPASDHPAPVG